MPTKLDTRQINHRPNIKTLAVQGASQRYINNRIAQDLEYPFRPFASFPTPDSKLNFADATNPTADFSLRTVPPIAEQIFFNPANLWIDFQAQSVSNAADFVISFPVSTVGMVRYACFTLNENGKIEVQFTPEAVNEISLVNPGVFFSSGIPIGFVLLECTDVSGKFKTFGSATDIIENDGGALYRIAASGAPSGDSEGSGSDLLQKLFDAENSDPYAIDPNEIIDPFTSSIGTLVNMVVAGSELALSGANLSGSYQLDTSVSNNKGKVDGFITLDVQEIQPNINPITADTIFFDGDVSAFFQVGKNAIVYREFTEAGSKKHRHIHASNGTLVQFEVVSSTYDSLGDETTLVLLNPFGYDLTMGQIPANQVNLKISPFDIQFLARALSPTFDELKITDANAMLPNVLGIPAAAPPSDGSWSLVGSTLSGSVISMAAKMSPSKQYGIAKVIEKTASGDPILHVFYTSDSGANWAKYSTTRTCGIGSSVGGNDTEEHVAQTTFNSPSAIGVADNGKWACSYWRQPPGIHTVWGLYGDIGAVTINDTGITPTDVVMNTPTAGSLFYAAVDNYWGQCSIDEVDGSWVMFTAIGSAGNLYLRSFTGGGSTHELLYNVSTGFFSVVTFNGILGVTGTGSSHRASLARTTSAGTYAVTVWDQNTAAPVYDTVIDTAATNIGYGGSFLNNRLVASMRNSGTGYLYLKTGTTNATPSFGVDTNKVLSVLPSDLFFGEITSYTGNAAKHNAARVVQDPADEKHAFVVGDMSHPDGVTRSTLFEMADVTDYLGVQISNYATGSGYSLRADASTTRISQTFDVSNTRLRSVAVKGYQIGSIDPNAGYTFTASIYATDGTSPIGSALATSVESYNPGRITKSSSFQWIYFNFPTLNLVSGRYAVVMDATYPIGAVNYLTFDGSIGNVFTTGQQRNFDGSNWIDNLGTDAIFEVNGEWVSFVGEVGTDSANTYESRNRNTFESQISLKSNSVINFVTRMTKNPRYGTEANSFENGHLYRREITINAPGTKATIGSLTPTGYLNFDDNLLINVELGTDEASRRNTDTSALDASNKAEDRSGYNMVLNSQTAVTYGAEPLFDSGQAGNFNGTSSIITYGPAGTLFDIAGNGGKFAIEAEFLMNQAPSVKGFQNTICSNYLDGTANNEWIFSIDTSNRLSFRLVGLSDITQGSTTAFGTGVKYRVKVTGNGTTIRLFVHDGSNWIEEAYATQRTTAYNMTGGTQSFFIGNFPNNNIYAMDGKIGYVKVAVRATDFVATGFTSQPAFFNLHNTGVGTSAERRIGQDSETQGVNFDEYGYIDHNSATTSALVDSYRKLLRVGGRLSSKGPDLSFKIEHTRGTVDDLSKFAGYAVGFKK